MRTILLTIITSALTAGLVVALSHALDKQAYIDCLKWQEQAEQYPNFYLAEWQAKQCRSLQVEINAPVVWK